MQRNGLKLRVLVAVERSRVPLTVPEIAVLVSYYPIRGLYPHCRRLQSLGLLDAIVTSTGKLGYGITERGRKRMLWLREKREA